MHIAIVYNKRPEELDRNDPALEQYIEGDEQKTIEAISNAIITNGHQVSYITVGSNTYSDLVKHKDKIDLVFNLAEGISGTLDREAQIPILCEMIGIPYTGPSPLSCALILNKSRAKQIWKSIGLATAHSQLFTSSNIPLSKDLKYPLIIKPNSDGSGIGIHSNSIVNSHKELQNAVNNILTNYRQNALAETYLSGREFTVAIVGNGDNLTVLPIIEINFASLPHNTPAIDSYEAKFVYGATGVVPMHETEFCPADLNSQLQSKIVELSKAAYLAIGCQDFGRLDIRLDTQNNPYVLEINYPPGLMSDPNESSFFTIAARTYGWDFPTLIGKIINTAKDRLKL